MTYIAYVYINTECNHMACNYKMWAELYYIGTFYLTTVNPYTKNTC